MARAATAGFFPQTVGAQHWRIGIGYLFYALHGRLRRVGDRNLELAFPEMPTAERKRILRGVYRSLGRLLAEFTKFPSYTRENVHRFAIYDGFENYQSARDRGKGVLFMTAHLGGWEIGSFAHSLYGHPLNVVGRKLDNPYLDRLVNSYRTMHGNRAFDKDDFARGLLAAMRKGETVGILMDTNMTPPQGVFVEYFGAAGLYCERRRASCVAHRCRRGSGIHDMGREH